MVETLPGRWCGRWTPAVVLDRRSPTVVLERFAPAVVVCSVPRGSRLIGVRVGGGDDANLDRLIVRNVESIPARVVVTEGKANGHSDEHCEEEGEEGDSE